MKTAHVNLLLAAVAVGLFALLVVDENREKALVAKAIERQPPLTALDANAIRSIRLRNAGSPDVVLEKTGSGWQLRAPIDMPADLVQVGNLTAIATLETRGSIDTAVARRADLGLDPPRSTVVFDDVALAVGEIEPLKRSRYIELVPEGSDRRISLVDDFPLETLDGEYTDLINKALLPFEATIAAIELPGTSLVRDVAGHWTATPPTTLATPEAVQALVEAWGEVRALATLPALTDNGPGTPADVTVQLADGTRVGYWIADRGESRFLQRVDQPVSYQLLPAEADRLIRLPPPPASAAAP